MPTGKEATAADFKRPNYNWKWAVVILYHFALSQLPFFSGGQEGWENLKSFKFYSFLLLSPIVKYLWLFKQCPTSRSKKEFVLSILGDSLQVYLLHFVALEYCRGVYFFLYPFVASFSILLLEVVTYFSLDYGRKDSSAGRFVIKFSKNPMDYMLMTLVSLSNYCSGESIGEYGTPITGWHCLGVLLLILQGDFTFGFLHYLTHNVPALWKHHKLHHEYKREDLNSIANFYSDLPDGISMNSGLIGAALLSYFVGFPFTHEIVHFEFLFGVLYSHSKYPTTFLGYLWFYELDFLGLWLGEMRTAEYHHHHHMNGNEHFCVFGAYPDSIYKKLIDPFTKKKYSHAEIK